MSSVQSIPNWLKVALAWLVVLLVLAAVVIWIGPYRLLEPWSRIEPLALVVALVLMLMSYALRALRIQRYFHAQLRGRFWPTLKLATWHNLSNNLLPMRTGEVAFPVLMQRYFQLPASRTVPVLLWFRLLDLQAIVVLGLAAALLGTGVSREWFLPVAVLLPAPFVVYLLRFRLIEGLSARVDATGPAPTGLRPRLERKLLAALESLPGSPTHFVSTLFWTWLNWLVKLAALAWILSALAPISHSVAVLGAIGGDLTTVLPIHAPGGFGTFEVGVMAALQPFSVSSKLALAAAINLHLFLLGASLLAALLAGLIRTPAAR